MQFFLQYVPVEWQIYARHGKARGRFFFPTNQQLDLGKKKVLSLAFSCLQDTF
jgi:hypothetical protein